MDQPRFEPGSGFTLIELSIVLVIIGLIIGGILVGRDLVHAAEIRAVAKDLQSYETAYNTFRLKYNCLPGDCPNATDLFGAQKGQMTNGDGDGKIEWYPSLESAMTWWEMVLTGVLGGTAAYNAFPNYYIKYRLYPYPVEVYMTEGDLYSNPGSLYGSMRPGSTISIGYNDGITVSGSVLPPADISMLDSKTDDGAPSSGALMGFNGKKRGAAPGAPGGYDACLQTTGLVNSYNVGLASNACRLVLVIQ